MSYPLPIDTAEILNIASKQNHNLGLALDKFLPINGGGVGNRPEDVWKLTEETKRRLYAPRGLSAPIPTLIKSANGRRRAMFQSLQGNGHTVLSFQTMTDYRLVVGFGSEHVLETNLCLHRIYGFPIIPGSAVKGVTRAWAFWDIAQHLQIQQDDLKSLDKLLSEGKQDAQKQMWRTLVTNRAFTEWQAVSDEFYRIFGTTEHQGQATFFDAYPTQAPTLKLDILNPHYGKYYQDGHPPADYLSPVPTYFLTVDSGSRFEFAVASKDMALATKASSWLRSALTNLGIGGKTSAGYGFMRGL